jgi:hypothetical protein
MGRGLGVAVIMPVASMTGAQHVNCSRSIQIGLGLGQGWIYLDLGLGLGLGLVLFAPERQNGAWGGG